MMNTYPDFQHMPAVSRKDTCGQLQALIPLHGIILSDDSLMFPVSEPTTNECDSICFDDIIYIASRPGFVDVVVRSGHLYVLSTDKPKRACINLHREQFPKSGISLQEAVDMVHVVWLRMNEGFASIQ